LLDGPDAELVGGGELVLRHACGAADGADVDLRLHVGRGVGVGADLARDIRSVIASTLLQSVAAKASAAIRLNFFAITLDLARIGLARLFDGRKAADSPAVPFWRIG
jgi:hypothetical protein